LLKDNSEELAVCVKDASKNYGSWWKSTRVLHDINLHVPKGIMYVYLILKYKIKNKR